MKSNYAKYIKEREDLEIIEDENGFASYILGKDYVYIKDIYVVESKRNLRNAFKYANKIAEIAKSKGINLMMGSVCLSANGVTRSLKLLLSYGMQYNNTKDDMLYFSKEL